ncbi:hypothetical protein XO12_05775 [Marinitoga sp. 1154]|uniref:CDP-glycerol glycerophosphotransferase family protein n=1 Tax=Marinitoga sp. 1154 TaxID=1643335 RepID=UPI001586ADF0|nr:CDP-glycerol glycerophosphotransferase family protein [Marinitoga sp. 1154]NUU99626.1 hypothetical protein [Marinitoga sp. 1154]
MLKILNFIYSFSKTEEKLITLYYKSYSGSNTLSLYKFIPENFKKKYIISLYKERKTSLKSLIKNKQYDQLNKFLRKYKKIFESKMLITTHGPIIKKKKLINIELWHGFPLKSIGLMDKNEKNIKRIKKIWKKTDYMLSYSQLYNVLMVACEGIDINKFVITGMPRNDFLFKSDGKKNLSKIFEVGNKKVVFFMPTFRKGYKGEEGNKNFNNVFGFEKFNEKEFLKFLKLNNILFIAKLHPNEENKVKININEDNFKLLKDSDLEKNDLDLYELINGVDLLITDYSSIYFDYLLLDRPIIFTPVDLEEYRQTRGLLLEPYNQWTPGEKATSQNSLQETILKVFTKDKYKSKRNELKNIVHYYQDGNSSQRVWNLIDKIMEE